MLTAEPGDRLAVVAGRRRRVGRPARGRRSRVQEHADLPGLAVAFTAGLVEVAGGRLRLTGGGVLVSNDVFGAFV